MKLSDGWEVVVNNPELQHGIVGQIQVLYILADIYHCLTLDRQTISGTSPQRCKKSTIDFDG